jgi:sulfoxide reductase heme-binding subunit YedZ
MAADVSRSPVRSARKQRERAGKVAVGVAGLLPLAWLGLRAATGDLGANPIAEVENQLGLWALVVLLASLTCTPIHIVTRWAYPLRLRRLLGLEAFLYAGLHFTTYLALDQQLDVSAIWQDIVKRKFMTVGFAALVLLIPLAVTSTKGMVKRLGFPRWKRLHRLVYLAAALAVVHFIWRVKSDLRQPLIYAFVLAVLLLVRAVDWARGARDPERHRAA